MNVSLCILHTYHYCDGIFYGCVRMNIWCTMQQGTRQELSALLSSCRTAAAITATISV